MRSLWLSWTLACLWCAVPRSGAAERRVLAGHVPSPVPRSPAIGRPAPTTRLTLALGLPWRDPAGLNDLLAQLYDPASPRFHQFLTPEALTAQFGPTAADYEAVQAFARAHGLAVTLTYPNRLVVDVEGAVADIERALGTTLRVYPHPTEARTFYAPDREPSVDAALPLLDISGLSDYGRPVPHFTRQPLAAAARTLQPNSGSGSAGTYSSTDLRTAYAPGVALTGAGQTVALAVFDGYLASDIAAYEAQVGLPSVPLSNVTLDNFSGTPSGNGGQDEVSLDIEMTISMAPGLAKVIVYEGNPSNFKPNDVLNRIASDNAARQVSCSWSWTGGPSATTDQIFQTMAAQGQAFFSASGDSDSYANGAADSATLYGYPCESPYVTSVGGTVLTTSGAGGAYASEAVWNTRAWDSSHNGYGGSSGGSSTSYAIPSWQKGVSMTGNGGSTTGRNFPDVALTATNVLGIADGGTYYIFSGTSVAAPLWAGFTALVNQQCASNGLPPIGFLNPAVYYLGKSTNYAAAFHDVTTGDNRSPDLRNSHGSTTQFYAVAGYDLCTGWGTPAGSNLITALVQLGLAPSFTASPTSGAAPLTVTFTDTSGGAITNRSWSFGDGGVLATNATSFTHQYLSAGTNTVRLTISGPTGTNRLSLTNYVVITNTPAQLWVSPASWSFGSVVLSQSSTQAFQVANLGGSTLSGTATSSPPFSVVSNGSFSVAAGSTSLVRVAFSPAQAGTFATNVTFTSNGGNSTNAVTGVGLTPAQLAVTTASWDFGWIALGTNAQHAFVVTNSGGASVTGGAASVSPPFNVVLGSNFTVGGFSATNVLVRFSPVAAGAFTNALVFTSSGGGATNLVSGQAAAVPVAAFTAGPTSGVVPLTVTFTDGSSGTTTNRFWDFGDGATTNATTTVVAHTYRAAGSNTVSLTVTGPVGTNALMRANYIVATNAPPQFWVSPTNWDFGLLAVGQSSTQTFAVVNLGGSTLTGGATSAPPFLVVSNSSFVVPPGQTSLVAVAFSPLVAGGLSNALVFSSDGGDATNLVSGEAAEVPVASFSADQTAGVAPLTVTFTDNSTGTITNRFWDFGDGTTADTSTNVIAHTYGVAGSNTVSLVVTGPVGTNALTLADYIVATNYPPPPQFWVNPTNWDFGLLAVGQSRTQTFAVVNLGGSTLTGGATSAPPFLVLSNSSLVVLPGQTSLVSVVFSPALAGSFTNPLVFTSDGGDATDLVSGEAAEVPVANFSADQTAGLAPLTVTFTDNSTGAITNRFWDFGDGTTADTSTNVIAHTYGVAGSNTVSLVVTGPVGTNLLTLADYIVATNLPPPQITAQPQSSTNYLGAIAGLNVIAAGAEPLGYQWQFNGTDLADTGRLVGTQTGGLLITNLQPGDAGTYQVVVTNAWGSATSAPAFLAVAAPPFLQAAASPDGTVALSWTTLVGHHYQLQSTSDLTAGGWVAWGGLLAATNETLSVTDFPGPDGTRFYRVLAAP